MDSPGLTAAAEVDRGRRSVMSSTSTFNTANRDAHVRKLMKKKENEFLSIEQLRVFVGTWNVNGKTASEDLAPWFKDAVGNAPSLIVLGFQELDLSKEALVFADSVREAEWRTACEAAVNKLDPNVRYCTVQVVRMVGVMLILLASDTIVEHIDNVAVGTVPTGIMGFMDFQRLCLGNKGGVAIRLEVHNSSLCFITSHLAAHMEQKERRNQDFRDIKDKMVFTNSHTDQNYSSNISSISKHDLTFWLGDLNYRITDIPLEKVKLLVQDSNWQPMLEKDQLLGEKAVRNVFEDYQESAIAFPPTYKYDVGTDTYDTSEKARCPAWTDRILYKGKHITPFRYTAHMELRLSDHKPVSQVFDVGVKVIHKDQYRNVYEEVMKHLDKLENEYLPQVKLNAVELNFGEVRFMEPSLLTVEITNTGQVPADFSFIPKLNESSYCKDWLIITPSSECILPGETVTLNFTVHVDEKTTAQLNTGQDSIDDIIVLHLDGGKDFFLTVIGEYTLSCFGCSLQTLIRLPDAVRDTPREQIIKMENGVEGPASNDKHLMPVPKELYFLLDNIDKKGKLVRDLFQQRGLHQEIVAIREFLDTTLTSELPGSIHSIAEALLIFLDSLREPVIPFSLYDDSLSAAADRVASISVISRLPATHKKVFEYIIEFMLELLKFSDDNYLDSNTLGNVFGPVMIRTNCDKTHTKADKQLLEQRKARFISNFLHSNGSS